MKLSKTFKIGKSSKELDFVDVDLSKDSQLYVDPILLYKSPIRELNEAHTLIVEFFDRAIKFVKEGNNDIAKKMCQFPDAENLLGIAGTGVGHGPRRQLGLKIFNELVNNKEILKNGLSFLNEFQLLIDGISFDLVSDAAVQITKEVFIRYTQTQCELLKLPMERTPISYFDWEEMAWDSKVVNLPLNPFKHGKPILLTPKTIARRYPTGNYIEFYNEIYKEILYEKEKETLWKALGKKPKISYSEIADKYKSKEAVIKYTKNNPGSIKDFFNKVLPSPETMWLENYSLFNNININKVINKDVLRILKQEIKEKQSQEVIEATSAAIEHQLALKRPKRRIIAEVQAVTNMCKSRVILLLGNYNSIEGRKRLEEIKGTLSERYIVLLLEDIKGDPSELLPDTLIRIASLVRFIIVEDSFPGGQLFEIPIVKSIGLIALILREKGKISSYMSLGLDTYSNIKEIEYELLNNEIDKQTINNGVLWAEDTFKEKVAKIKDKYPWNK